MGRCAELHEKARLRAPLPPGAIQRSVPLQVEAVSQVAHFCKNRPVLYKTTRHWCPVSLIIRAFSRKQHAFRPRGAAPVRMAGKGRAAWCGNAPGATLVSRPATLGRICLTALSFAPRMSEQVPHRSVCRSIPRIGLRSNKRPLLQAYSRSERGVPLRPFPAVGSRFPGKCRFVITDKNSIFDDELANTRAL